MSYLNILQRNHFYVLLLTLAFFSNTTIAQNDSNSLWQVVTKINTTLIKIEGKNKSLPDSLYSKFLSIKYVNSELSKEYSKNQASFSQNYISTLRHDAKILDQVVEILYSSDSLNRNSLNRLSKRFSYVQNDFFIKNVNIDTYTKVSASNQVKDILVTVNVMKGLVTLNGYSIYANPEIWFDKPPQFKFNDLSSPTSIELPPGDYIFTASYKGKTVKEEKFSVPTKRNEMKTEITLNIDK